MKWIISLAVCGCRSATLCGPRSRYSRRTGTSQFVPGEVWLDTNGKPIQAHGGGILVRGNTYYWYGEDRTIRQTSVSCYSSTDLYTLEA